MQTKYNLVIADTSCLILFEKIGEFDLLSRMFNSIIVTKEIAGEFGSELPTCIEIREVENISFQSSLELDPGEASAIALAIENTTCLLIIDDKKGRRIAQRLDLNYTGSLGIFLKAKQIGLIPSVRYMLNKVQLTNFRYSEKVFNEILTLSLEDDG